MSLDHLSLAVVIISTLEKNKLVANVTPLQVVGTRNPSANFTVIGANGAVLQIGIKRLMKGQPDPEPEPDHMEVKLKAKAKKASKKK